MYAVAYFHSKGAPAHGVFPNVFPDLAMAEDCVIFSIKDQYGTEVKALKADSVVGGQHTYHHENTVYVIGKLFNFNPKGY